MKRRYFILAFGFVAFVGIVLGVLTMLPPRPGLTQANYDRIEKGMTLEKVKEIFGEEPIMQFQQDDASDMAYMWDHEDGTSAALVFHEGKFFNGMFISDSPETAWQKLRRWLTPRPAP